MQMATVDVKLESMAEADQFLTVLTDTNHIFDIDIKLNWKATRAYLTGFLVRIADTKVVALELDGIIIDIHPEDLGHYTINLFADILRRSDLKIVTLLNYPRPKEQCIYVDKFALQLKCLPTEPGVNWNDLRSDLRRFYEAHFRPEEMPNWRRASKDLLSALAKHGISKATSLSIYDDRWQAVFDFAKTAIVDVHLLSLEYDKALVSSGALVRLTVDTTDPEFDNEVDHIMHLNEGFRMLNIYIPGGKEINQIGELHASLSDYSAMVLECAIRQHPAALKSFTLDVTCLSQPGVASIQNTLRCSKLEHLRVVCSSFAPDIADSIPHLLNSVNWSTLKSLELSGDDIDTWIQLWMTPNNRISAPDVGSVLQSLTIHGRSMHVLAHATVLFIHQLVFVSPLELHLENIRLQDENDWRLIIDAVNDKRSNSV
ncbi:hypothetical protein BGZ92_003994 [Podila epicladia]|nr:hypothetical protein BGZ92_003994 [Podila epicladia]